MPLMALAMLTSSERWITTLAWLTMAPATEPAAPPPLGGVGFARWCWRQLTSMRVALILLFLLAIAAIPGSVPPLWQRFEGCRFAPRCALAMSLALHELTTNAIKYGALSADGGRYDLWVLGPAGFHAHFVG